MKSIEKLNTAEKNKLAKILEQNFLLPQPILITLHGTKYLSLQLQ